MSSQTIFERILAGAIPADKVYEDEDVLAFRDVAPQAPVHVLVIPKQKLVSLADLADCDDDRLIARLFRKAALVARQLGLDQRGYRLVVNHGADAQQSVAYLHIHILGGRPFRWPPG